VISADPETTCEGVPRNAQRLAYTASPQRLQGLRLTDYLLTYLLTYSMKQSP
jgi:hypothetical protein